MARRLILMLVIGFVLVPALLIQAQEAGSSGYRVVEVIDLERPIRLGETAIYLNPDGSGFAYLQSDGICLYSLPENEEQTCYLFDQETTVDPYAESARWSPDGRYLAFVSPGVSSYIDSDIFLLDRESGEIRNITDDGYDGGFGPVTEFDSPIYLDYSVAWSDEGQLGILRYPILTEISSDPQEMQIISVDPETGDTELIRDWSIQHPYLYFSLAWSGDLVAAGRSVRNSNLGTDGIDLFDVISGERLRVVRPTDNIKKVYSMQFSADGEYLLAYNPFYRALLSNNPELDGVGYIQLPDGSPQLVDEDNVVIQAGFAPEGTAVVYIVYNGPEDEANGLYIAAAPGEPGELVLPIESADGTTWINTMQLTWATNNTIMIRDNATRTAHLIVLEEIS